VESEVRPVVEVEELVTVVRPDGAAVWASIASSDAMAAETIDKMA